VRRCPVLSQSVITGRFACAAACTSSTGALRWVRPVTVAVLLLAVLGSGAVARGQVRDASQQGTLTGAAKASSSLRGAMAGSLVELSTYIGSGSFYASGYHDPYASVALFVKPTYALGTRFGLSLNARLFAENELTTPDNPDDRHLYLYDPWVWLSASNLHTFQRSKIRVAGLFRTVWPVSPESRYQHLIVGVAGGLSLNRRFVWNEAAPEEARWSLSLSFGTVLTKYIQTSHFRGSGPSDTSGCRGPGRVAAVGAGAGEGPTAADADTCGGPANPNIGLTDAFVATLEHGRWSLMMTLLVANSFKYEIPRDMFAAEPAVTTGRTDLTWGIVALGYTVTSHLSLAFGLSSQQPALDAENRHLRFPFFDLSGGLNANNYTQVFFSLDGTL